jgi:uncharacterized cupin superfamily protein
MAKPKGFTIKKVGDADNIFKDYPGEMRPLKDALGMQQVAVTHRKMPKGSGSKGGYGHKHSHQEEIVYVISGKLQVKLDDEVHELEPNMLVRIDPPVARGLWNEYEEDVELLIISNRSDEDEFERISDFWPVD